MRRSASASPSATLASFALALSCGASEQERRPAETASASGEANPGAQAAPGDAQDDAVDGASNGSEGESDLSNPVEGSADAVPVMEGGRYVFRGGGTLLEVDPALGGRVTRFSLGGRNVLTGPEVVAAGPDVLPNMFGSTFWTSPQSDWGWPPETEVDSAPHESSVEGDVLSLSSPPGSRTGYGVDKRFSLDASTGVATIDYSLINHSATAPAAPWEISRVPKQGLVFFPSDASPGSESSLASQTLGGVAWVDVAQAPASDSKLFQDGSEGWLAYVQGDLAFIKTFENVPASEQATGEAEIEIFVSGDYGYVEIEQQGRYASIPTGGSTRWTVRWLLRRRPSDVESVVGNPALVDWVRGEIDAVSP